MRLNKYELLFLRNYHIGCFSLIDRTGFKKFGRSCPNCKKELLYSSESEQHGAASQNSVCISCGRTGVRWNAETLRISLLNRTPVKDSSRMGKADKFGNNHPRLKHYAAKLGISVEEYRELRPEFVKYRSKVYGITNLQPTHLLENFDKPRGLAGIEGVYHLDHIVSIKFGFDNNIDPEIIGHFQNLQFIPWEENYKKRTKCSISLDDLLLKIKTGDLHDCI